MSKIIFLRWPFLALIASFNAVTVFYYTKFIFDILVYTKLAFEQKQDIWFISIVTAYLFTALLFVLPIFDWVTPFTLKTRRISDREQKVLLNSLNSLEKMRVKNRDLSKSGGYPRIFSSYYHIYPAKFRLRLIDQKNINAYAYGNKSIAISRATLNDLGNDELEAVLAHEIAHLIYKDPFYSNLYIQVRFPFGWLLRPISHLPKFMTITIMLFIIPTWPLIFF